MDKLRPRLTTGVLASLIPAFILLTFFLWFHTRNSEPVTVYLIGDSTMSVKEDRARPETGWGMPFAEFFDSTVTVENHARNGRSTKTFFEENRWQPVYENLKPGDYVFIQFGHNDEAPQKASYTPPDEYQSLLTMYVNQTREKGAIAVLLTPVTRRRFDDQGYIRETHAEYSALMREVARELDVLLIDMDNKSKALLQSYGQAESVKLFLQLEPGEHPNYPDGVIDNTHFNEYGARKIAELVTAGINELNLELAGRIAAGITNRKATVLLVRSVAAQNTDRYVSDVWVADNGDGTYTNPIIHADYSDPDVIRVGEDFYMVSSSFNATPGLPILHSKDLVNWELIGHALKRNVPEEHFRTPRHAQGVWAPSFRYHNDEYYIYWGDPDFGIYMIKADHPSGDWSKPHLVKGGKGLIDSSPLWDDDGRAYLVYAFAGSRAGIKSLLVVQEMTPDGKSVIGEPVLAFDGHDEHETVEGPKFYKRGDYYYILAPAGGVTYGWQLALRSKDVFGPYEEKIVMHTGSTDINGPHQGGMVELESGESWFVHFQDRFAYGRIVHLNPVRWEDGWPLMGIDKNGDGIGEPVGTHKKPDVGGTWPVVTPPDSDEFNANRIGLQWQWHANPLVTWAFPAGNSGFLRLFATQLPDGFRNYWDVPHLLLQKFPAPAFSVTTKFKFTPNMEGEKAGLIVMGRDYSYISVTQNENGLSVSQVIVKDAGHGNREEESAGISVDTNQLWFRVDVDEDAMTRFSYSTDGENFTRVGSDFQARQGGWIGAKVGLFCSRPGRNNDSGFADFDWFRLAKY